MEPREELRVSHNHLDAPEILGLHVRKLLAGIVRQRGGGTGISMFCICIGTDRSTGDALGPLVGQHLAATALPNLRVIGTIEHPVHASNLQETLKEIEPYLRDSFTIAVDACLGKPENIGSIAVGRGPLRPGAGVNKSLPSVGDVYVTGTVNVGGIMEYLVLQNTRLSLVMKMAQTIASGLQRAFQEPGLGDFSESPFSPVPASLLPESARRPLSPGLA